MKFLTPIFIISLFLNISLKAQVLSGNVNTNGSNSNAIFTAVPFLNIAPDARSGAMGDAGVALAPSVYDIYWNASKLAFLDNDYHVSLSYSPWLRKITPDANLANINFVHKLGNRNAMGFSVNYFNLGNVNIYDPNEVFLGSYHPNEWSINFALARKLSDHFSMGLTMRYIHSAIVPGSDGNAGKAIAADVSLFYTKQLTIFGKETQFNFGTNLSNIGSKMSYYPSDQKYFLPANLRIGAAEEIMLDQSSKFTMSLDLNKLLVPSPPLRDSNGKIIEGKDDERSVASGTFGSFTDAPGGFKEEIKEIAFSLGTEYMYKDQMAIRAGYFYENPDKGDRRYLTLGAGYKYKDLQLDFSYLIASQAISPLSNTLRLTLGYSFNSLKKK
jgi:hypothetical protein